jgi:hypothetical protein
MMREPATGVDPGRRERAYREANRLIVAAGIVLAGAGVVRRSPEMKALSAALRAVNQARESDRSILTPRPNQEDLRAYPSSVQRPLRRAAP